MSGATIQLPFKIKVGKWWFQRRSFSPLPFFIAMLLCPRNFTASSGGLALAFLGVVAAESLRLWAVGFAGSATRTRGDKVPQLVHSGPYRSVRNPLYIANILLYTCCGVFFGVNYLVVGIFVYSCIQYHFIVAFEESLLVAQFGKPYKDYCAKVPKWLMLTPRYPSSNHPFNLRAAFRSERSTLICIAAMLSLYCLKTFIENS